MKYEILNNLILEVTRDCNLECENCYKGEKQEKYMSMETIDNAFSVVTKIYTLRITGGEPLLALDQLKRIYKNISEKKCEVNIIEIYTNGTIISSELIDVLKKLSEFSDVVMIYEKNGFKQLEYNKKGLEDIVKNNFIEYSKYVEVVEDLKGIGSRYVYLVGKACNLTDKDLKRADDISGIKHTFKDDGDFYLTRGLHHNARIYISSTKTLTIYGDAFVTVDGNICAIAPDYHTYEDEDILAVSNINEYGNVFDTVLNVNNIVYNNRFYEESLDDFKKRIYKK